jgi:DNA mismatch endonuclease (patch repair protein)
MRANRGKDTTPEIKLRSALHARGLRFRKNLRIDLGPGRRVRPDVTFGGARLAVFVDGCYWHGCTEHRSIPASNVDFWYAKITGTRRRDVAQTAWLEHAGWTVIRVWEHEPVLDAVDRISRAFKHLRNGEPPAEGQHG